MKDKNQKRLTRTFPIDIDVAMHKTLKMMAIESDMTLHAFIISVLTSVVAEYHPEHLQTSKDDASRSIQ
ncbi:MAG: hypothetical protein KAR40_16900 [Candidatus Sabulitectum sp.]|nr:hypothetical protein [Candidatus Sabulitectum sp.]